MNDVTTHTMDQHDTDIATFGFWLYIMSDCLLFAALFATYAVLRHNTFGGPSPRDLFSLPFVFLETML
jgi:cytochrome o ubiquinol oxidase subunit 3